MIGYHARKIIKAVPKRLQRPPYTPPLCKLVYKNLGEIHPTQHDESDELEKEKIKKIKYVIILNGY
jgi:hypothetical protein